MQKWYENRTFLNTAAVLTCIGLTAYLGFDSTWGLPLFLSGGTAIMVRGVVKITTRMRTHRGTDEKTNVHKTERD